MVAFKAYSIIFFTCAFLAMIQEAVSVPVPAHGAAEVTTPKVVHPATHGHHQVNVHEGHQHPHNQEGPGAKCCWNPDIDGKGYCRNCKTQQ